jgi:hypothetical protein
MERRGRVKTGIGAGCLSEKYDSAPEEFKMNAPIEIGILDARGKALAEMQAFLKDVLKGIVVSAGSAIDQTARTAMDARGVV